MNPSLLVVDVEQLGPLALAPETPKIPRMDEAQRKIAEIIGGPVTPEVLARLRPLATVLCCKTGAINALLKAMRSTSGQAEFERGVSEVRRLTSAGILSADDVPELLPG
ncbi:hypothetical protein SGO26_09330 [Cupriavidus metallidurans]|uniref:hypothetical protein n=1 Tax=Cupriavidus TaxID=106589 RepID=UPI00295E5E36|nr:hypothetical protein [Cupriavidus sp. TKC]